MSKTNAISVRVPASLAWDCGSCGDCCRNFELGPVDPAVIAALKDHKIGTLWPPAAETDWVQTRTTPDGQTGLFLSPGPDGACVFLRPDNLCSIHATLGASFKPSFCREYPAHGVLEEDRLTLIVRPDCSNFHNTFDSGTPLSDQVDAFMALPRPHGLKRTQAESVALLPGLAISAANWTGLETTMLADLDGPRTPEQSCGLIRQRMQEEIGGTWPTPQSKRAGDIRTHLTRLLINALTQGLSHPIPDTPSTQKMKRILTQTLNALRSTVETLHCDPAPLSTRAQAYFDLVLRSNLLSKGLLSTGPLSAGLGAHLFGTHLVREMARDQTRSLTPTDLGPHFAPWVRFTHNGVVQHLLRQSTEALTELFLITPTDPETP